MPRWVQARPAPYPYCRVCHKPHAPSEPHVGSPDDWAPPANLEEARERVALLVKLTAAVRARSQGN